MKGKQRWLSRHDTGRHFIAMGDKFKLPKNLKTRLTGVYCDVEQKYKSKHCGQCSKPEEGFDKSHELRAYTVSFKYLDGKGETLKPIVAHSPKEAIEQADKDRKRRDQRPIQVMAKNSIGAVIATLGRAGIKGLKLAGTAIKKGAELGARGVRKGAELGIKGARGTARAVGAVQAIREEVGSEYRTGRVSWLVKRAQSEDPTQRALAKRQLRKVDPELYKELFET